VNIAPGLQFDQARLYLVEVKTLPYGDITSKHKFSSLSNVTPRGGITSTINEMRQYLI